MSAIPSYCDRGHPPLRNAFLTIVAIHGNTTRSIHQAAQPRGHETSDEEEKGDDEFLDYSHTQLDRCVPIENTERAVILKICEKAVEKANGE